MTHRPYKKARKAPQVPKAKGHGKGEWVQAPGWGEMAPSRQRAGVIGLTAIVCTILLVLLEGGMPHYGAKTLLKILLLGLAPFLVLLWQGGVLKLGCRGKDFLQGRRWAVRTYAFVLFLALAAASWVDLDAIRRNLGHGGALPLWRFLWAGLVIALLGSLLEEYFFRGFSCQALAADGVPPKPAWLFSAGLFSLYHAAIIGGWFPPLQLLAAFFVLFGAGLFFGWAARRYGLCAAWLCHGAANLALLTVGAVRFYT